MGKSSKSATVAGGFSLMPSRALALTVVSVAVLLLSVSAAPFIAPLLRERAYKVSSAGAYVSKRPRVEIGADVAAGAALGALPRVMQLWPVGGNNSRAGVRFPVLRAVRQRWG